MPFLNKIIISKKFIINLVIPGITLCIMDPLEEQTFQVTQL